MCSARASNSKYANSMVLKQAPAARPHNHLASSCCPCAVSEEPTDSEAVAKREQKVNGKSKLR